MIGVDGRVSDAGKRTARCPFCGKEREMAAFDTTTGLYYKCIRLIPFHTEKILVCPDCRRAFKEETV